MSYRPIRTEKGYAFFEVASALQKSIRRGEEESALYFSVELSNSGYDEYLWKRLKIITSEDIGLAEPLMPAVIQALYEMYRDQKKKRDNQGSEWLFLAHAVMLLCRASKSRLVDWTVIAMWGEHEQKELPIPDYAYDKHTAKGRSMGRGLDHFYQEGTKLSNAVLLPGEGERKSTAYHTEKQKAWKNRLSLLAPEVKEDTP